MGKKDSLPKLSPLDYLIAKKDLGFKNYVATKNTDTHYNLCNVTSPFSSIIIKIQKKNVFKKADIKDLEDFTTGIDRYLNCDNFINTFKQDSIDLPALFNSIIKASDFVSLPAMKIKKNLQNHLLYLFSIVKHCQAPDKYPIGYKFWMNINDYYFGSGKNNYDDLCSRYNSIVPSSDVPKHVYFAAYLDKLARDLANALAPSIIRYTPSDIKNIFNIKDYDSIMGVTRNKNKVILPATPPQSVTTMNGTIITSTQSTTLDYPRHPLNLILYGPPGTGKTYNTVNKALDIIEPSWQNDFKQQHDITNEREYAQKRFDYYKNTTGQIVFTTFHQSMSYEDFIEGIKPVPVNDEIIAIHENDVKSATTITQFGDGKTTINNLSRMKYEVSDGIFKQICNNAKKIEVKNTFAEIDFTKTRVFKMSLGEKGKDADYVFDYCVDNEVIALGWGGSKDFSKCTTRADFKELDSTWGATALEIFKDWMKTGDIVLISDGTKEIKGIAQIEGNYEFRDEPAIDMHQYRKVKWLYTGDNIPISKLYDKNLSKQSIYGFYKEDKNGIINNGGIKVDVLNEIITGKVNEKEQENYVLIIDEINRGNVAQIFGELITLIEENKRLGNKEAMTATLPYSQKTFGVPCNLYIIGTMNTADRSVEALDTALRRRFSFEEMMPKPELLNGKTVCGVGLDSLLETINKRIVALKDREHQIGHSYFMDDCLNGSDEDAKEKWLAKVFKDKIIPLLQEYFYGDYKKIYYVLGGSETEGEGFVKIDSVKSDIFAVKIDDFEYDIPEKRYEIQKIDDTFDIDRAIKVLLGTE